MTATKHPVPDEMSGADASAEPTSLVRHIKKARTLRWGHQDETAPGEEELLPEEQARVTRDKSE